jgi:hypothetical protein
MSEADTSRELSRSNHYEAIAFPVEPGLTVSAPDVQLARLALWTSFLPGLLDRAAEPTLYVAMTFGLHSLGTPFSEHH